MKSVHFAATNIMYSPLPWSPSPGGSTSSLPPSPSIATLPAHEILENSRKIKESELQTPNEPIPVPLPPPAMLPPHHGQFYSTWLTPASLPPPELFPVPVPVIFSGTQIHILLSFAPAVPPNIRYDVTQPPNMHTLQPTQGLMDAATSPALAYLELHLRSPRCRQLAQRVIAVRPGGGAAGPGPGAVGGPGVVSVFDVLASVYTALRIPVRADEYAALGAGDSDGGREMKRRVDSAYFRRCDAARRALGAAERDREAGQGVRWVDVLAGAGWTRFMGLSGPVRADAPYVWELHVAEG
ncbi:hypothetical protein FB45DRAFT_170199 [Roridomyces roridus]|uniref:DUF6699 domain-containing protein n=1 Tax=Roridomyces roridus TaxID=1738132 RepID=A0AAD7BED8_9AGAR|nr:hypothetical protein FB45DRAFT_170199 [Roridomyces roridus]